MHELFGKASSLLAKLYIALDAHDFEAVAGCFSTDGVWIRQGKTLRGREEIQGTLSDTKPAIRTTIHVLTNVCIDSQSDREGTCRFYLTVYRHNSEFPPPYPVPTPGVVGLGNAELIYNGHQWLLQHMKTGPYVFAN